MAELSIREQTDGGVPTVYLQGELDSYSAPRLRAVLETLTGAAAPPSLRVHLGGLDYIDSTGLGVLVAGLKQATDRAGSLCLIAPGPAVARVLHITGLDRVFPIVAEDGGPV